MLSGLVDPLDARPLGVARMVIGIAVVVRAAIATPDLIELSDSASLRLPVFGWMPEPTTVVVVILVITWGLSGLLLAFGWHVAVSGSLTLASIVFLLALDQQMYGNHLYLMAWLVLLLIVADAGAGFSVDRPSRPVARWTVLLLMLQVSIVYFFSAVTKLNEEFLFGSVLAGELTAGGIVGFPSQYIMPATMTVLAFSAILTEVFVAFALWSSRLRRAGAIMGIGLHGAITLLMQPSGELLVFSMLMLAVYPLFLTYKGTKASHHALATTA